MGAKKLYTCERCVQHFRGRVAFDYHMNAHRRTDPPKKREPAPKPAPMWYDDSSGNTAADTEGAT